MLWNQNTLFGYTAAIVYTAIELVVFFTLNSMIQSFFIGVYLHFDAFYKHYTVLVKEINCPPIEIDDLEDLPYVIKHKKQIYAKQMLREMVQFFIFGKE